MGAVTSIIYCSKFRQNSNVSFMILDSPFSDLQAVMGEIATTKTNIPRFMIDIVISIVKGK